MGSELCHCRSLPPAFAWDTERTFLDGKAEQIDEAPSLALVACRVCGQLWRLELPPQIAPRARKVAGREGWAAGPAELPPAPAARLPVLATVSGALALCWRDRRALGRVAALPWLLLVAGTAAIQAVSSGPGGQLDTLFTPVLWVLTGAMLGLAWTRRLLLGERASWLRSHAWSPRHPIFLLWSAALEGIPLLGLAVSEFWDDSVIAAAGVTVVLIVAVYVTARLLVALPSAAVGAASSPAAVWALSSGAGLSLVAIVVLITVGSSLVLLPPALALREIVPADLALLPLSAAGELLVSSLEIGALAVAYRRLAESR